MDERILEFSRIAPNPKMTESTFLLCLNGFLDNQNKSDKEMDPSFVKKWLSVVNTEYTRVDVVDEKTGEILFWAPPLRYKPDMSGIDHFSLIKKTEAMAKRGQLLTAKKMIQSTVSAHIKKVTVPKEDIEQWNIIYKRYGLNGFAKVNTSLTTSQSGDVNVSDYNTEDEEW